MTQWLSLYEYEHLHGRHVPVFSLLPLKPHEMTFMWGVRDIFDIHFYVCQLLLAVVGAIAHVISEPSNNKISIQNWNLDQSKWSGNHHKDLIRHEIYSESSRYWYSKQSRWINREPMGQSTKGGQEKLFHNIKYNEAFILTIKSCTFSQSRTFTRIYTSINKRRR